MAAINRTIGDHGRNITWSSPPNNRGAFILIAIVLLGVMNLSSNNSLVVLHGGISHRFEEYILARPISVALSKYPFCTKATAGREPYVCEGPRYEEFADKLEQFILWAHGENNTLGSYIDGTPQDFENFQANIRTTYNQKPTWGRRLHSPFPADSTILVIGNSHSRSIFLTLACQYSDSLLSDEEILADNVSFPIRRGPYYKFEFANHAKLHLITNHEMFYSKEGWRPHLEKLTGHNLEDFDLLFYGRFNDYSWDENGTTITQSGITLTDIAKAYPGPIVAHTLMADWYNDASALKTLTSQRWRMKQERPARARTISVLDGRHYANALGYCSTDEWSKAGICEYEESKHACMGKRGGHPDLIAWEMLEAAYEMWGKTKAKFLNSR